MGSSDVDTSAYTAAQQKELEETKRKEDEERKKAEQDRISMMRSRYGGAGGGIPSKPSTSLLGG